MAKDYYQILGVSKNASQEEIKKFYYKLAHQYHPHKGGDETKMKEINEAYSVLGNAEKRQQYDQYGQTFEQARAQGGFSGFGGFRDFSDFAEAFRSSGGANNNNFSFEFNDLGDIFGDLFGLGGTRTKARRTSQRQGADLEVELNLEFTEAAFGVQKEIKLDKNVICRQCRGTGAEPGAKILTCSTCRGTGQVVRNIGFGIGLPSVCSSCNGQGKKAEKDCRECQGRGVIKETETTKVKIPAGIDDGQTIRLAGKGEAGQRGAAAGDLYLRIRVRPDPRFVRNGYDIRTKTEISFPQSALGTKIEVETLDGKIKLKIPEGTQSGRVFRIAGKGVPILQGRGRGDHLVKVIVKTPTKLNRKQKKLLEEFDEPE